MGRKLQNTLLITQLCLFLLARVLDDLTWYLVGLPSKINYFESVSIVCNLACIGIQIIRKRQGSGMWRILFVRSQLKFLIPWALVITIDILYFNIFGCQKTVPEGDQFYVPYTGCCLAVIQMLLTNLNFSLICNTRATTPELILYELILFAEIIYEGNLTLLFIGNLEGKPKDYSILLISIMIANQVLIMDLVFRAAYEDREREEQKERKLLNRYKIGKAPSESPLALQIELTSGLNSTR